MFIPKGYRSKYMFIKDVCIIYDDFDLMVGMMTFSEGQQHLAAVSKLNSRY
jgi:hypothetical protein